MHGSVSVKSGVSGNMGLRADYRDSVDGGDSDNEQAYKYFDDMESTDGGDRRVSAWVNKDALRGGASEDEDDQR